MTDPRPGTTMGRIAALEARYAELAERLDRFERDVLEAAWPKDPPKRSPESATGGSFVIRNTERQATAFGFGTPGAYVGGASVDEGVREERWRDAMS